MSHQPCPELSQLSAYLLGQADEATSDIFDAHILHCENCQTVLARNHPHEDTFVAALKSGFSAGEFDDEPALRNVIQQINERDFQRNSGAATPGTQVVGNLPEIAVKPAQAGLTLGPYRLLKVLGSGGMGRVFLAEHSRLEMIVAVKVLADHLTNAPQAVARFDREMKAVGRFNHPNIVRATDAGEFQGQHYLAMEYIDGRDLFQIVRSNGPLKVNDACEVIRQAAVGVQHAHEHGLIHRDLKPSNLMVTKDGLIKVLDLGLARLHSKTNEGLTSDFQVMGTADYIAPEQALKSLEVDFKVDIYSLGCTLYALLCGQPPFADEKHSSSLRKIIAHEQELPKLVHERRAEVPVKLSEIINIAMAKSSSDRFTSAHDFGVALQPFADGANLVALYNAASSPPSESDSNTSAIAKHLATTDTTKTVKPGAKSASPLLKISSQSWPFVAAIMLLFASVALASLVVEFHASNGTMIVEIDGDLIQTSLDGERVVIEDKNNGTIYHLSINGDQTQKHLTPGTYEIRVENESSGLRLDTREFQITRHDATVVKAYLKQADQPAKSAPSLAIKSDSISPVMESSARALAEWALTKSAIIAIRSQSEVQFVDSIQKLPDAPYRVITINFTKPTYWKDEDFDQLGTGDSLAHLEFQDLDLTERIITRLSDLQHLGILRLRYDEAKPRNLVQLNRLPHLKDLTLGGTLVGDEEVAMLRGLKNVCNLTVSGTQVTDAALQHVAELDQLEFLSLIFTKVDGRGIVHLQKLKHLWSLHLPYTLANDAGTKAIAGLPNLTWLNLGFAKIGDGCLDNVVGLGKLEILELNNGTITGEGLKKLQVVSSLRKLDLQGTLITDADVDQLASLNQLTTLLIGDRLSAAAVARLQAKLPGCEIKTINEQ